MDHLRIFAILAIILGTFTLLISEIDGSPSYYASRKLTVDSSSSISHRILGRDTGLGGSGGNAIQKFLSECDLDNDTAREFKQMCQRCAKVTKSNRAYRMCCDRQERTDSWCQDFLNFGQKRPNIS